MLVDLNADLGEGSPYDAELLGIVTSANVCCGQHAGNPETAYAVLELAGQLGAAVGAHPGYADREHFGRRELTVGPSAVWSLCAYQIGGLVALAQAADVEVAYVKPHGALYHRACRDREVARAVVAACALFDLPVVGLPGSALEAEASDTVPFVAEGFADRRYRPDGTLLPRTDPGAFVADPAEAVLQVERLVREKGVRTICVHGDNPAAVAFAAAVREALAERGIELLAFA